MTNIQAIDLLKDLEQRLDDYCELNDEGKTAFRMAIEALEVFGNSEQLPSAEPDHHIAEVGKKVDAGLISRRAAIDIERNATVDTNPSHFEAHQKFTQFMDDAEISSFGRWQWSNGFNTALTAVGIDLKKLPSAQPEQRYTKEELRVFQHGISLSLLSKRSAQHWRYDEDTATEIKFLERLYEKVGADIRSEHDG